MTTALLALIWSALTATTAAHCLISGPRPRPRPGPRASAASEPADARREIERVGARVLSRIGVAAARGAARAVGRPGWVPGDPGAVGAGIVAAGVVVAVLPAVWPGALVVGALPVLMSRARRIRARAAAGRAVLDELPEVIDLLGLAVAAGLTAPLAVAAVGRRGPGVLAATLAEASVAANQGRRLADVLDEVPDALGAGGDGTRPLLAALADSSRHGTSLGPSLERLAAEARTARRHRAEERARRVPVLLLFPLVTCTLPALGLLTIAPLAVGALRDLRA